jgi:hypothetical protein
MFHLSSSQGSLFESQYQISERKAIRLQKTWAQTFRERCFPLIDETRFRSFYCEENGAPCKSIRVVVSALILQALFDFTDAETQAALDFDLRWHLALGLDPCDDQDYVSQRTLQYFREKLLAQEMAGVLFAELTDRLIAELGLKTSQQRLDTTHILSNFARRSRLSLFCETHRLFLHALQRAKASLLETVPASLRRRYLEEDGTTSTYADARSSESRRRLAVAARDAYRLREAFRGVALPPAAAEAYAQVERLVNEHCTILVAPCPPAAEDGDADLAAVPVVLKEAKSLTGDCLQTPHDPGVTYSGHKGQGYEALITETCDPTNAVQLITQASLERSCESDADRVLPTLAALAARGLTPASLLADTAFGSVDNTVASAQRGVELVAPQPGTAPTAEEAVPDCLVDERQFQVQWLPSAPPSRCPYGAEAVQTVIRHDQVDGWVALLEMPTASCTGCPQRNGCSAVTFAHGATLVLLPLEELLPGWRRAAEREEAFRQRYGTRAGIEGTNSEMKRGHGLGHLRVRGTPRVALAMFFRLLACNMKRAMYYWGHTRPQANKRVISEDLTLTSRNFYDFLFGFVGGHTTSSVLSRLVEFCSLFPC